MATIEVTVCDVCRSPERRTTQFAVAEEGVGSMLELCKDHAAPLRELLKHSTVAPLHGTATRVATARKVPVRRKRAKFDSAVATMEEIEARRQP